MRKHRFAVYAVMTATVLFSAMAGTFVSALANSAEVKHTTVNGNPATPGNASSDTETASDTEKGTETETGDSTDQNRATPGNAASDPDRGDGKGAESPAESDGILYTVSSYDFWCLSQPMLVKMGAEFNPDAEQLPICIDVYLEGPDGFLYDPLWLVVDWDLSGVDFNREGEYRVTGILDTASCEVPVDWDHAPLLSFIIKVDQGGTLSFTPETDGNILTLSYVMNGDPYTISDLNYELYESRDGGTNWRNITRDNRVWAEEDHLTISGVEECSTAPSTWSRRGSSRLPSSTFSKRHSWPISAEASFCTIRVPAAFLPFSSSAGLSETAERSRYSPYSLPVASSRQVWPGFSASSFTTHRGA